MDPKYHGNVDFKEVVVVEERVMQDPTVLAEIAKLQLPSDLQVVAEAWGFGSDIDDARRQYQVYMFVGEKSNPDSNHYARPLAFSPVWDPVDMKLVRIDHIPTGSTWDTPGTTGPWDFVKANEYVPEAYPLRKDLKPLQVIQPAGTSYNIDSENILTWQKWRMRVCFNYREGLFLRDVSYDGRPVLYRISLSEMTVPYADPRAPYHRKQAFDLGDVGAGLVSNNLKLGCDCLGSITYLDGLIVAPDGEPLVKENAICVHEQDNGIGWKHSNYRTEREFTVPSMGDDKLKLPRCLRSPQSRVGIAADLDCVKL